jgi:hypothetical protein
MEKEMVPYELALRMKAIGFDEPCFGWFKNTEFTISFNDLYPKERGEEIEIIKAPTFSQAFRFFREKYDINKTIARDGSLAKEGPWAYTIVYDGIYFNDGYLTYEEAELACLEKLIEIVKQKENI